MRPVRYGVVLTHNRPRLLDACVEALEPQADHVIVVDNASDPPVAPAFACHVEVVHVPDQPPNLARLWNRQLDRIAARHGDGDRWDVALLCDDVILPGRWFDVVAAGLRAHDASAASTHSYVPAAAPYVLRELTNGADRMCPWAFLLRGEDGLRADETLRWWYCDTDLDWQARRARGTVVLPGPVAHNELVGDWTAARPELGAQAHADGRTFHAKWVGA